MHERLLSSMKTSNFDPGKPNEDCKKKDPNNRSSNFEAVVSDEKNCNQCPMQDDVHRFW